MVFITVVTISLRVMVRLIIIFIIRFSEWKLSSECMQFSIAVG